MRIVLLLMLTIVAGCSGEGAPAQRIEFKKEESTMSNKEAAIAFLEANRSEDGITETASGLQYKVISSGSGDSPALTDTVSAHYAGRLLDGTEFDSSYARGEPLTIPVGAVIKGWTEALTMMKVGDKWTLYIPPELGYGERGAGGTIPPNSALIFDVELIEIK
jgi:FKBP-type peptidyl-prolyl cis-trans isomerase